jgi:hypothetical protein
MKEHEPRADTRRIKSTSTSTSMTEVPSALLRLGVILQEIAQTSQPSLSTREESRSARKQINNNVSLLNGKNSV